MLDGVSGAVSAPNPNSQSLRFFADSQGGLWAIEYGIGLWYLRPDGTAVLLTVESGLPSRFITCWLEDNKGNIWIGTKEARLARIRCRQFKDFTAADGIPGGVAQSVCEYVRGTICVGNQGTPGMPLIKDRLSLR